MRTETQGLLGMAGDGARVLLKRQPHVADVPPCGGLYTRAAGNCEICA